MTHRINLKGPWDFTTVDAVPGEAPASGTAKFPAIWQDILGNFRGSATFTRHFNRPTNLEGTDRVDLVFDGIGGTADVYLNQRHVGCVEALERKARIDITQTLRPHNVLEIRITWHGDGDEPGGLWAPVALEISSTSE